MKVGNEIRFYCRPWFRSWSEANNRSPRGWMYFYYFIIILSGVRLSQLGTAAATGLLFQPQMLDDGDWWNEDWRGKPKYSEKAGPSATLPTTNPTSPDPDSNPDCRSLKPATNLLSYGTGLGWI
jgi:hypothetical protein